MFIYSWIKFCLKIVIKMSGKNIYFFSFLLNLKPHRSSSQMNNDEVNNRTLSVSFGLIDFVWSKCASIYAHASWHNRQWFRFARWHSTVFEYPIHSPYIAMWLVSYWYLTLWAIHMRNLRKRFVDCLALTWLCWRKCRILKKIQNLN